MDKYQSYTVPEYLVEPVAGPMCVQLSRHDYRGGKVLMVSSIPVVLSHEAHSSPPTILRTILTTQT